MSLFLSLKMRRPLFLEGAPGVGKTEIARVLSRAFDPTVPSHQCGTARFGTDPDKSVLDIWCRAHDHPNLFVVDASFLPNSAAVNPALTIAAQALRVADHIKQTDLVA